jgi:TrmH family RNA methyltransferase
VSVQHVTSSANTTLKRLRSLHQKKYRRQEGLFLAEGLRICVEALDAGWVPATLVYCEGNGDHPLVRRLILASLAAGAPVIETSRDLLSTLTGKDNPQAVAAAYRPRPLVLADLTPGRRTLVAERLRDPGNLGTLLRACDAAGADALILLEESADPTSVEAVRASMGAVFTVQVATAGIAEFLAWKARHDACLIGAALDDRAEDYRTIAYPSPSLLLVGNEQAGLPEVLMAASDRLAILPMHGKADSLNVAMAGTLLLYEALRWQDANEADGDRRPG